MGNAYLERGQILTGRFGRRYMVRSLLQDNGRFQIFEISESGTLFWGVVLLKGSNRFKSEFLEKAADSPKKAKEFVWPEDVFNFDYQNKKLYGYVVAVDKDQTFKPIANTTTYTSEQRFKIGYGLAKAFSKLHIQGCALSEFPAIWCNSSLEVKLFAVPIESGGKFAKDDVLGIPGINAPEEFAVAAVKTVNSGTDDFLLAALLFTMFTGVKPFVASQDINYAYAKFVFAEPAEVLLEKYGHDTVERWVVLGQELRDMFRTTFTDGVTNASVRFAPDDWAYKFATFIE